MRRNFHLAGYLLVIVIVLGSLAASPQAWATPNQTNENQTVPTRTPKPSGPTASPPTSVPPTAVPPTSAPPTAVPPAPNTSQPQPTATRVGVTPTAVPTVVAPATPQPTAVPTTTAPAGGAALSWVVIASPIQVWSGVTVVYTLTAVNRSTAALRDVVLLNELPAELQPDTIFSPKQANWQGTVLRAALAELAPGAQAEVVFAARVAPGVPAGKIIVNRASLSAAGVAAVTATASVAMPPAELPRVGGGIQSQR
jgi:hypothetical protein